VALGAALGAVELDLPGMYKCEGRLPLQNLQNDDEKHLPLQNLQNR
jgi:hypothetical protein